ncbi:hypothetical protein Zmor_000629 [Zophobas morio]|uniref:Uncharacterized protein n=1 Tax=Zophobas morio TaxID=2755281 RepID=A0AA38J135_9CUCU|nr:hypothetical protein Zmor_000629 [Zophobas morio]
MNKKHGHSDTMDREKDNNASKKITPKLKNANKQKSAAVSNNNETSQKFVTEKKTKVPVGPTNTSEGLLHWDLSNKETRPKSSIQAANAHHQGDNI